MHIDFTLKKDIQTFQELSTHHTHDGLEVLICLSDGGKFCIGEKTYPLNRGMMFVVNKEIPHHCIANIASYARYILHVSYDALWMISSPQTNLMDVFTDAPFYVILTEKQLDGMAALIERCIGQSGEFGDDIRKNICFLELMLKIVGCLRHNSQQMDAEPSKEYSRIQPMIEYVHRNYAQEISLEQVSRKFFVSKYHLSHQFKMATGFSLQAYIINYRIRQSCILLRKGVSVQAAGERVGFGNNAHYIRTFGKVIGMSPGRYAKKFFMTEEEDNAAD